MNDKIHGDLEIFDIFLFLYFVNCLSLLVFLAFQILSQCNIYEAGEKKTVFKYMPEKVIFILVC